MIFLRLLFILLYSHYGLAQYTFYSTTPINNVIVGDSKVIVGSVNRLVSLNLDDLSISSETATGPVEDNAYCSIDGSSCLKDAKLKPTDNHNQLLLSLPGKEILVCGSVRQGICGVHSSVNVSAATSKGDVPVASNTPRGRTKGVLLKDGHLMIAASYDFDSPYRDSFPAVSLREAPDYQVVNSGSLEGEGAVFVRSDYRNSFAVDYITVFEHEHFVYFAAVQPSGEKGSKGGSSLVTKLIRICKGDTRFVSYSEIELQCRGSDNSNRNVLTAAVIQGDTLITAFVAQDKASTGAVCMFNMSRIKLTFWYNIDRCRGGTDSIGLPHIGRDTKCVNKAHIPLDEDSCELGVGGTIEALEMAAVETSTKITSLAVHTEPFLLFAGTTEGEIVQFKPKTGGQWEEYGRRSVFDSRSGREVNGLFVNGGNLVIQLENAVSLLPLAACAHLLSCSTCILSPDPLCRWCHAESKCASSSECKQSTVDICPMENGEPVPNRLAISQRKEVKIGIANLPEPSGYSYECLFGHVISKAKWSSTGVSCRPPRGFNSSQIINLSVLTNKAHHPIVTHSFSFYDCAEFQTCSSCISSDWGCNWCATKRSCADQESCKEDKTDQCVQIGGEAVEHPILVPNGKKSLISFPVLHMNKMASPADYFCRTTLDGKTVKVPANVTNGEVKCQEMIIRYSEQTANKTAILDFTYKDELIDSTKVIVFECAHLASDCSTCVSAIPLWGCNWCGGKCSFDCAPNAPTTADELCDRPTILGFHPSSAPLEGGSLITITGRDLGVSREDIEDRVFVGGTKCAVTHYEVSKKIVCRVEKGSGSGPVRVSIGRSAKRVAESSSFFSFVDIGLFSVYPLFGPISGGTKITVYGQNLNAGSNATVFMGDYPCRVVQRNSSQSLTCVTTRGHHPARIPKVRLEIDDSQKIFDTVFEYRPDPMIRSVFPLTTFQSGGRMITVEGSNFDSVLSSRLFLLSSSVAPVELVSELATCQIVNASTMVCMSPKLFLPLSAAKSFVRYPIGFAMDDVPSVRNLGQRLQMTVVPDPQFVPFKGVRIHHGDQALILDGDHLSHAAEPQDYKIFIGTERCYVTLVDTKQLVCAAPHKQPEATDEKGTPVGGGRPMVTVTVGRVRHELGLIEYADMMTATRIWMLALAALAALCVVVIIFFIFWKKRRAEREKDYKKIQMQMENLESNVRKECKQAFAELQTTLSSCAGSEDMDSPHFHPLREFVLRLLWSEGAPHPSASLYGSTLPVTLAQFDSLLSSKHFVFSLVEAAESDPSMCPGEKHLLSSLIISVLARNFQYCTEVVLSLLRAHIAKSVHNRSSDLLFRKSESLVERLFSKWLSICLYEHLTDESGRKFYTLYKALKIQTEKGPVDAVTGQARYTINESKLLRETVDVTPVDTYVMGLDGRGPYTVHLLLCDTISQAKQKVLDVVFKHVPHSQRPTIQQFDIEWQDPQRGNILLLDEDRGTTKGVRKVNTLGTYGVPQHGLLLMMPASKVTMSHRYSVGDSGQSSWSSIDRTSNPYYSSVQYYHLSTPTKTMDKKRKLDESIPKNIPEVYLTRLLTSKGTVQKYIDDFLESVLFLEDSQYPVIMKYMFDFFDEEAARNGIADGPTLSQWKSNCWILRVWAGLVKNPKILFDVAETASIDGNLSVIAQTMMDCFSTGDPILGVDSPSSRLLFAKDIARLRPLSADLFKRIRRQPRISEGEFVEELNHVTNCLSEFGGSTMALSELLTWVRGNGIRMLEVLSSDPVSVEQRLPHRLGQVINLSLESEHIYATLN